MPLIDIGEILKHNKQLSDEDYRMFAGIEIAHMRTPLTGMMGYLSMLAAGDFGKLSPEQSKVIEGLLEENQRLLISVNQLTQLGRLPKESTPMVHEARKSKIFYFEDDTFLAGMYVTKLGQMGCDVRHFDHPPANIVDLIVSEKPDLIFMDIIMPKMSGFEATELLQADPRTRDIPIFGMSNLGQKEDVQKALFLGMWDYWVSANHMPTEVVEKIRSILNGEPRQPRPPKPAETVPVVARDNAQKTRSSKARRWWIWVLLGFAFLILILALLPPG